VKIFRFERTRPQLIKAAFKKCLQTLFENAQSDDLQANLVKGAAGSFALKISNLSLSLVVSILLARLLGVKGYGVYAYAMALIGLLSLPASLGLPELLVREVAAYRARSDWGRLRGLLQRANQASLSMSVLLILLAGAISWVLAERFDSIALTTFWLSLGLLPMIVLNSLREATLRGLCHVVLGQLPDSLFRPGVFIVLSVAVYWLSGKEQFSPKLAMDLQLGATATALVIGTFLLIRRLPKAVKSAIAHYDTRVWLKSSVPFLFLGGMFLINSHTDIIMLGWFRSAAEVGVYRVATTGAGLVTFALLSVNLALGPRIVQLYQSGEIQKLQRIITLSSRGVLLFSLPLALIFIFFGEFILSWVFGAAFGAGSTPLAILCIGQLINAGMGSVGLILNMTGHEHDSAEGVAIAAAVNVVLNTVFIPMWGLNGAAGATAISMVTWNTILSVRVHQRLGMYPTVFGSFSLREAK